MAAIPILLGAIPPAAKLGTWLLMELAKRAQPAIKRFLEDPAGSLSRVGDVLVWQGDQGKQVVATLESLTDSQARIEQVVARIETAQIGVSSSIGSLMSLSMATLGVTSLAAGIMVWRMNALHQRLHAIGAQIADIQTHLHAMNQAHLQTSLDFLSKYEHSHSHPDLHTAVEQSTYATNVYRDLLRAELGGRRRLIVLNQCGRYFLLALTAQVRCLVLSNELPVAEQRLIAEKSILAALARTTFEDVLGKTPEVYLDPNLQEDGVTLQLMTEIYQQANRLGATSGTEVQDAGQMFEHFRPKLYGTGGWFRSVGKAKINLLTKLKFLMACLEEVGRIESLHLRVRDALAGKLSFPELEKAVALERQRASQQEVESPVVAFAIA